MMTRPRVWLKRRISNQIQKPCKNGFLISSIEDSNDKTTLKSRNTSKICGNRRFDIYIDLYTFIIGQIIITATFIRAWKQWPLQCFVREA